jgi:hypothetical protein
MSTENKLKAGMLFMKDGNIYLLADSSNQRWFVDIITGTAKWAFKANEGTVKETEAKGYKYYMTTKELLEAKSPEVPKNIPVTPDKIIKYEPSVLPDIPNNYSPLGNFEAMLKGLIK